MVWHSLVLSYLDWLVKLTHRLSSSISSISSKRKSWQFPVRLLISCQLSSSTGRTASAASCPSRRECFAWSTGWKMSCTWLESLSGFGSKLTTFNEHKNRKTQLCEKTHTKKLYCRHVFGLIWRYLSNQIYVDPAI